MNEATKEEILEKINDAIAPPMTLEEANEALGELIDDISLIREAIREDIRRQG